MTRRIGAAMVGLVLVMLAAVVVPLGLITVRHTREDFVQGTLRQAQATAQVAEEHLSDHGSAARLVAGLNRMRGCGDTIVVLDHAGHPVASTGTGLPAAVLLRARTVTHPSTVPAAVPGRIVVAAPVSDGDGSSGMLVQARSTATLAERTRQLWATLAVVALLSVAAAVALAVWLSRWVGRPVRRLAATSRAIGAGNLDARAGDLPGPDEVRQLGSAFDGMASRLQALITDHRSVVADVSHQLRTPIMALRLRLELLAERLGPADPEELAGVLDEVDRLSRMVDGLLTVARAEAMDTAPVRVDLTRIAAEREAAWRPLAEEQHAHLAGPQHPGRPIWVLATPGHLEQVLDNLIANSLDAQPPPTRVGIGVTSTGRAAILTVDDNGPGMTRQQYAHAFERFHSGRGDHGTGLGLTIVRSMVVAGGGSVDLAPTPGGGLTVTITLPLAGRTLSRPPE